MASPTEAEDVDMDPGPPSSQTSSLTAMVAQGTTPGSRWRDEEDAGPGSATLPPADMLPPRPLKDALGKDSATNNGTTGTMDGNLDQSAINIRSVEFLAWGRHTDGCYPHGAGCNCHMHRSYCEMTSVNCDPDWTGLRPTPAGAVSAHLPSVADARKLVRFHLDHVLWHHSTFHALTFLERCERLWQFGLVDHQLWMALYLSMLSVSMWSLLNSTEHQRALNLDELDEDLAEGLYHAMIQVLYNENFLQNFSVYSIQAIVVSIRVSHSLGFSNSNVTLIGAAVRMAHYIGLHKICSKRTAAAGDSSQTASRDRWFESVEREVGKRTWWQLVTQDFLSIPFTDTYIINPAHFTTDIPLNCDDHDLIARDDSVPTISSYVRVMARIASLVPSFLDGMGPLKSIRSLGEMYKHILAMDQAMRRLVQTTIPQWLLRNSDAADADGQAPSTPRLPPWVPLARRSLALTAADKIIMIHRPLLFRSFQEPPPPSATVPTPSFATSLLAHTSTTCVSAALTILREHEALQPTDVGIWTHSAFCITAAIVLGLELLHRPSHTDASAGEHRALLSSARDRLASRCADPIAARGVLLIDAVLAAEEELVLRLMRSASRGGGRTTRRAGKEVDEDDAAARQHQEQQQRQRAIVDDMVRSHEVLARFLALGPVLQGHAPAAAMATTPPGASTGRIRAAQTTPRSDGSVGGVAAVGGTGSMELLGAGAGVEDVAGWAYPQIGTLPAGLANAHMSGQVPTQMQVLQQPAVVWDDVVQQQRWIEEFDLEQDFDAWFDGVFGAV